MSALTSGLACIVALFACYHAKTYWTVALWCAGWLLGCATGYFMGAGL